MNNPIFNLTKRQRLDMQMKGLSPLNPEHVEKYINSGGKGSSFNESVETAKRLIGADAFSNTSLGHKNSYGSSNIQQTGNLENDIRSQIKNDMKEYSNKKNLLESLEDFNEPVRKPTDNKVNIQALQTAGYNDSIAYLNTFIRNLKSPSSNGRMEIYKALQALLKKEQTYKNNPTALKAYQSGCQKGEGEMFAKLKNQ